MRPEPVPAPERRLGRAVRGTGGRNPGGEIGLEMAREKPSRSTGKTAGASPDPSTSAEESKHGNGWRSKAQQSSDPEKERAEKEKGPPDDERST
ncbi:hypothetical protein NDU88_003781 [Pleurodeles waltl]|uniref:Uncharacterized protein n=1 Tax=Pleurodeles waltl TaxID=8319 RepID=A0AAV7QDK6_PLEWA|nr:hypothetical protein NDU88_003781 [Pleurodeles waltl]